MDLSRGYGPCFGGSIVKQCSIMFTPCLTIMKEKRRPSNEIRIDYILHVSLYDTTGGTISDSLFPRPPETLVKPCASNRRNLL